MDEQVKQKVVNNEISRRNFLKASSAAMGTVVLGGVVAGCGDNTTKIVKTADTTTPVSTGYSFEKAPAAIDSSLIVKTVNAEVVVVGGGMAGCSAACSAAERGLSVVLLEKTASVNGRGGGVGTPDSKVIRANNLTIDKEIAQKYWIRTCGARVNEQLVTLFFTRAGEAFDWALDKLTAQGGQAFLWGAYSRDAQFPDSPAYHELFNKDFTVVGGANFVNPLRDDALKAGATFVYNSPGVQLVKQGGRVVAVIAKDGDGYKRYNASKGVVLATGDISGDPEMVKAFCPELSKAAVLYTPAGANTGDGHKMGMWVGGAMQTSAFPAALHPQLYAWFHAAYLFVNTNGQRFMNEATWVQGKSLNFLAQPNGYAYAIFDTNWQAQLLAGLPYGGGMFWDDMGRFYGAAYDTAGEKKIVADLVSAGVNGFQADSIAGLAAKINVDATTLAATVARYNTMVTAGADTDFRKDKVFLGPITEGPFYALKIGAGILATVGGLKINTKMNVLDTSGSPIPGLYAAGNTSGDVYAVDYPINIPGNSHMRALLWGYLAAETIKNNG